MKALFKRTNLLVSHNARQLNRFAIIESEWFKLPRKAVRKTYLMQTVTKLTAETKKTGSGPHVCKAFFYHDQNCAEDEDILIVPEWCLLCLVFF